MKAMVLKALGDLKAHQPPLEQMELPDPVPSAEEILVKISACGVCHTELDEIEGRTPPSRLPIVPGHQVVMLSAFSVIALLWGGVIVGRNAPFIHEQVTDPAGLEAIQQVSAAPPEL